MADFEKCVMCCGPTSVNGVQLGMSSSHKLYKTCCKYLHSTVTNGNSTSCGQDQFPENEISVILCQNCRLSAMRLADVSRQLEFYQDSVSELILMFSLGILNRRGMFSSSNTNTSGKIFEFDAANLPDASFLSRSPNDGSVAEPLTVACHFEIVDPLIAYSSNSENVNDIVIQDIQGGLNENDAINCTIVSDANNISSDCDITAGGNSINAEIVFTSDNEPREIIFAPNEEGEIVFTPNEEDEIVFTPNEEGEMAFNAQDMPKEIISNTKDVPRVIPSNTNEIDEHVNPSDMFDDSNSIDFDHVEITALMKYENYDLIPVVQLTKLELNSDGNEVIIDEPVKKSNSTEMIDEEPFYEAPKFKSVKTIWKKTGFGGSFIPSHTSSEIDFSFAQWGNNSESPTFGQHLVIEQNLSANNHDTDETITTNTIEEGDKQNGNEQVQLISSSLEFKEVATYCFICCKTLSSYNSLKKHHKIEHSGQSLTKICFKCPICGKILHNRISLQEHFNTHTGAKPYQCPICPKSFAHVSTLIYHKYTHASNSQKPYQCHSCKKGFIGKGQLTAHKLSHHRKDGDPLPKKRKPPTKKSSTRKPYMKKSSTRKPHNREFLPLTDLQCT